MAQDNKTQTQMTAPASAEQKQMTAPPPDAKSADDKKAEEKKAPAPVNMKKYRLLRPWRRTPDPDCPVIPEGTIVEVNEAEAKELEKQYPGMWDFHGQLNITEPAKPIRRAERVA